MPKAIQFPPGVPSTEGGSDRRTHPISGLLASLSLARCTKMNDFLCEQSSHKKINLLRVVGRADMQPPFKRTYPGSTPGRPTFGLLAQLAEQPPLKRKRVGSKPTQPTKCPCDAIGRHRLLKTSVLQVRFLSGVLAEMELWCALGSHKPSRTGFKSRLRYQMQV